MNVTCILTTDYIEINGVKIYVGNSISEIEAKADITCFISQKDDESTIVSENDYQLHFRNNALYMWTISPDASFFSIESKKIKLAKLKFNQFIKILFEQDIPWEFNQKLTFSDQICILLKNKVNFIFWFDEENKKGCLGKVGFCLF